MRPINGYSNDPSSNVNVTSSSAVEPGSEGTTAAPVADAATLLPNPYAVPIDIGEAMAEMLINSSFARRESERTQKNQAESNLAHEQADELSSMRQAADDRLTASRIEAGAQAIAGGTSIAGSFMSGAKDVDTGLVGKALSQNGGGADAIKGTGGFIGAGYKHDAELEDIQAKASNNVQTQLKSKIEDASSDMQSARDTVNKTLDALREFEQTRNQTMMAAIQRQ